MPSHDTRRGGGVSSCARRFRCSAPILDPDQSRSSASPSSPVICRIRSPISRSSSGRSDVRSTWPTRHTRWGWNIRETTTAPIARNGAETSDAATTLSTRAGAWSTSPVMIWSTCPAFSRERSVVSARGAGRTTADPRCATFAVTALAGAASSRSQSRPGLGHRARSLIGPEVRLAQFIGPKGPSGARSCDRFGPLERGPTKYPTWTGRGRTRRRSVPKGCFRRRLGPKGRCDGAATAVWDRSDATPGRARARRATARGHAPTAPA